MTMQQLTDAEFIASPTLFTKARGAYRVTYFGGAYFAKTVTTVEQALSCGAIGFLWGTSMMIMSSVAYRAISAKGITVPLLTPHVTCTLSKVSDEFANQAIVVTPGYQIIESVDASNPVRFFGVLSRSLSLLAIRETSGYNRFLAKFHVNNGINSSSAGLCAATTPIGPFHPDGMAVEIFTVNPLKGDIEWFLLPAFQLEFNKLFDSKSLKYKDRAIANVLRVNRNVRRPIPLMHTFINGNHHIGTGNRSQAATFDRNARVGDTVTKSSSVETLAGTQTSTYSWTYPSNPTYNVNSKFKYNRDGIADTHCLRFNQLGAPAMMFGSTIESSANVPHIYTSPTYAAGVCVSRSSVVRNFPTSGRVQSNKFIEVLPWFGFLETAPWLPNSTVEMDDYQGSWVDPTAYGGRFNFIDDSVFLSAPPSTGIPSSICGLAADDGFKGSMLGLYYTNNGERITPVGQALAMSDLIGDATGVFHLLAKGKNVVADIPTNTTQQNLDRQEQLGLEYVDAAVISKGGSYLTSPAERWVFSLIDAQLNFSDQVWNETLRLSRKR